VNLTDSVHLVAPSFRFTQEDSWQGLAKVILNHFLTPPAKAPTLNFQSAINFTLNTVK
jgi:hypothetical protein